MTTKRARKAKAPAAPTTKAGRISAEKHKAIKLAAITLGCTVMSILDEALGDWLEKNKKGAS